MSAPGRSPSNALVGLQSSRAAKSAQPAKVAKTMSASPSDPFGAKRFERSRAKTPYGYKRLFNKVSRELIGIPPTRKQRREIRASDRNSLPVKSTRTLIGIQRYASVRPATCLKLLLQSQRGLCHCFAELSGQGRTRWTLIHLKDVPPLRGAAGAHALRLG